MVTGPPTCLGLIASVSGANIHIKLGDNVASGLAIIGGKTYKIGQVGSFIRIPQGYQNLYGIISDIGADAVPDSLIESSEARQSKWIKAQLVGESIGSHFERGISQYPNVGDEVHLVVENDLHVIYGSSTEGQITLGYLSNAESIPAKIDIAKLITRHSAIVGSTGSGKSTTVSSLIRTIINDGYTGARILMFDVHGEYAAALHDIAKVYSTEDLPGISTHKLAIPYWALESGLLIKTLFGSISESNMPKIVEKITDYKRNSLDKHKYPGATDENLTVDSPIPFSIKALWHELLDLELKTFDDKEKTRPSLIRRGDAEKLESPEYNPAGLGATAPFLGQLGIGIKKQLQNCRSKILDKRYEFLLKPDKMEPALDGKVEKDLPQLISEWIGHDKQVTILDFSTVPSEVLSDLVGTVLDIVYESLYWGKGLSAGGRERPLLIVMEEAHKYLNDDSKSCALQIAKKIAKEGRKYGVGCMIVSQRPAEVDETILSQCGTFFALRLSNNADRGRVKSTLPDGLGGLLDMLPSLRTGEAIVTGEAANLPVRCRVYLPSEKHRPNSFDPDVNSKWRSERVEEDYELLVARWRSQNSSFTPTP